MDAWETLKNNSTLGSGHDAWEYLNAQEGGSGGDTIIRPGEAEVETHDIEVGVEVSRVVDISAETMDQTAVSPEKTASVDVAGQKIDIGICK